MAASALPVLVRAPAPVDTADAQLRALLVERFHSFRQWRTPYIESRLATLTQLRHTLDQLLPRLTGARDFAGAAKVLAVVYHRFSLAPALCVQASLEILRRHPEHRDDLLQFYLAALEDDQLDKLLLLKELWMFHVIHGDFYEAYALFKDKIQSLGIQQDPRLLANFGVLCYWLLFIESSELRDKFTREGDVDGDDEDDEDADDEVMATDAVEADDSELDNSSDDGRFDSARFLNGTSRKRSRQPNSSSGFSQWASEGTAPPKSVEALIESRYRFKSAIGVHILYQEAVAALRRAVSLCPMSAQFTEYYAQLLVLVGDVDAACNYLEHFYHLNPSDPHACRMLAGFLGAYYPDSTDTQISVYLRWLKNDPASSYALEKIMDLASAGSISSMDLAHALVEAVDACGGDLYLRKAPSVCATLWRHLAQLVAAMKEEAEEWAATAKELDTIGAARGWWKRVYFAHPADEREVAALLAGHVDANASAVEALVYRAYVAYQLFGPTTPIVQALCATMSGPEVKWAKPEHLRLFKSNARVHFRDAPFRHVVHRVEPNAETLPEFRGGQLTGVRVMSRAAVIVDANSARVQVKAESAHHPIDRELVAALEDAVRDEDLAWEVEQEYRTQAALVTVTSSSSSAAVKGRELALPTYVNLVEEAGYKDREAPINHVYSFVVESLRKLEPQNVVVPTLLEVQSAHQVLLERWERNEFVYGHPGLLLRYETFLAKFVQPHVHACIRAEQPFEPTSALIDAALAQMQTQLSGSHVHLPSRHEVGVVLRVKAASLVRLRRKLLRDFRRHMAAVLRKLVHVETRELAELAMAACEANGFSGCVTLDDLVGSAVVAQLRICQEAILGLRRSFRTLARDTIDRFVARDASDKTILAKLVKVFKVRYPSHRPSRRRLRACIWARKYERDSGPIPFGNLWEHENAICVYESASNGGERGQEAHERVEDDNAAPPASV